MGPLIVTLLQLLLCRLPASCVYVFPLLSGDTSRSNAEYFAKLNDTLATSVKFVAVDMGPPACPSVREPTPLPPLLCAPPRTSLAPPSHLPCMFFHCSGFRFLPLWMRW